MKVSDKLYQMGIDPNTADFSDILAAIDEPDSLELQKEQVGTDLVSLLAFTDTSRTAIAQVLGYKKSRITRILSGVENLTLRTIHDVCKAIGYEFDITFRKKAEAKPLQPWQSIEVSFEKPKYGKLFLVSPVSTALASNLTAITVANDDNWHPLKLAV